MENESWSRPGGRTEKNQGRALGLLSLLIGLSGGGELAAGLLLPVKREISLVWWIPMTLALGAGLLLFHFLRKGGKVAQMSGTKLLYLGLAALVTAGVLTGLCGLLPPLLCLPMVFLGLALAALRQGFTRAEEVLFTLSQAFPEEKACYHRVQCWGGLGLTLVLIAAYALVRHWGGARLFLHLLAGVVCPVSALAGVWLLDRRLCLSDQRGAELRRELLANP